MPTGTGIIFTMVKRHLKLNCHFLKKYLPVYNNRNTGDVLSALSYEIVRMKSVSIGLFCPLKMNNLQIGYAMYLLGKLWKTEFFFCNA